MTTANTLATIDQAKDLVHLNALETEIIELKEGYKTLTIDGPDDKDGYEKVRAAIAVLRPKRTGLDRERKDVVRPYNEVVKFINGKYDAIGSLIQEGPGGELELKSKKDAVDEILEKEKEAKRLEEESKINNRINEILKYMTFDGSYYSIQHRDLGISETSIGVVEIRTMSDELFAQFLQMVIEKHSKIAAELERVAALEKQKQEEKEAADKKEREEFEKKKRLLDEQEQKMKQQQKEIQEQQEKIDKANKEAEQNRINGIIRHRSAVLTSMELKYNENDATFEYDGEVLIADGGGIAEHDDVEWLDLLDKLKAIISNKKFKAEEFLKQKAQEEKDRMDRQEQERQAGLNDQQRMKEYADLLLSVPVPPFTTKKWKTIAGYVRDTITDNRPA